MKPPYFKQERNSTCSLAVLRMVLAHYDIQVTEDELYNKVTADYGRNFKNIWNPTLAKLACSYDIKSRMYADWPLFKPELLRQALMEYREQPDTFNVAKYENPDDTDSLPEPLPLAYKEMFDAVDLGCETRYGSLTTELITKLLSSGALIQTTVKLGTIYEGEKGFHSVLIYGGNIDGFTYHDPSYGESLTIDRVRLAKAINGVGAGLVFFGKTAKHQAPKTTIDDLLLPEYVAGEEPDFKLVGKKIDDFIKQKFLGKSIVVRALSSAEHPNLSRDELINIILGDGTDRYDPNRIGDRYENTENKQIDIFALPLNPLTEGDVFFEHMLNSFYHYPLKTRGASVFVDIVIIYDFNQLREVEHMYEGRDDIKRDGFVFKNPDNKRSALLSILLIS